MTEDAIREMEEMQSDYARDKFRDNVLYEGGSLLAWVNADGEMSFTVKGHFDHTPGSANFREMREMITAAKAYDCDCWARVYQKDGHEHMRIRLLRFLGFQATSYSEAFGNVWTKKRTHE